MIWFFIFVFSIYFLLIVYLVIGFIRQELFNTSKKEQQINFSIIIPFRNEAENLPKLITSIENLEYLPNLFEVIFIDDDSTDNSPKIIKKFIQKHTNCSLIQNDRKTNSPKKDAIVSALKKSSFEWIVTTDADCVLPQQWLTYLSSFIVEKNPNMVVAPVNYNTKNTFLQQFQMFDFMSLQGATIGSFGNKNPFLCNGANLAYKKEIFHLVNGFNGNTSVASGDDIFLFEKFLRYNKKSVHYLKSSAATVTTFPVGSWKKLIQQRIRWASKTSKISLTRTKLIGAIIFLGNLSIILNAIYAVTFQEKVVPFIIKFGIDLLLILPTLSFFNQKKNWWKYYFLSSLLYPFFSVGIVLLSIFTKYSWKGRKFRT